MPTKSHITSLSDMTIAPLGTVIARTIHRGYTLVAVRQPAGWFETGTTVGVTNYQEWLGAEILVPRAAIDATRALVDALSDQLAHIGSDAA